MEQITQQFIVDASAGIATLGNLRAALAGVNAQLARTAQSNVGAGSFSGAAAAAQQGARATEEFTRRTRDLTISWQTFTRVIATQAIVSAFGNIRREISGAIGESVEFQRRVALIQTLLDRRTADATGFVGADFGIDVPTINTDIADISSSLNIPIIEAATAAYEALSNQVGDYDDAIRLTIQAGELAKSTNSSLSDSVDLLSAAITSYNLEVEDSERLSAIFFTTIDQGRITADELANSFGRIAAPANELGVNLEELNFAISAISVDGFKTSETLTQFRGIVNSLQKPTEDLSDAIRQLGFESPQAAVQQQGLLTTLQQLRGTTEESSEAFFRLFPNIRGSTGVLSLLAKDADEVAQSMAAFRDATAETADEKATIVLATDAELLQNTLNRLRVEATQVGTDLLELAGDFIRSRGGAEELADEISGLALTVARIAADFAPFIAAVVAARTAMVAFNLVLAANPVVLIATAIVGLGVAFRELQRRSEQQNFDNVVSSFRELEEAATDTEAALNRRFTTSLATVEQNTRQLTRGIGENLVEASRQFNAVRDQFIAANDALVDTTRAQLENISNLRTEFVAGIERTIANADRLIQASQDRATTGRDNLAQFQFDASISGLEDAAQVVALTDRANTLARQAAETLSNAGNNEQQIQRGLDLFAQAEAEARRAGSIAEAANNRGLEVRAAQEVESILRQQIRSEEQLQELQLRQQRIAQQQVERQRQLSNELRAQTQIVLENTGTLDSDGNEFTDGELQRRLQRRNAALAQIQNLSLGADDFSLADSLNLTELTTRLQSELTTSPIQLSAQIQLAEGQLTQQFQQSFNNFRESNQELVEALDTVAGETLTNFDGAIAALNTYNETINTTARSLRALANAQEAQENAGNVGDAAIEAAREQLRTAVDEIQPIIPLIGADGTGTQEFAALETAVQTLNQLRDAAEGSGTTVEQFNDIIESFNETADELGGIDSGAFSGVATSLRSAAAAFIREREQIQAAANAQTQIDETTVNVGGIDGLQAVERTFLQLAPDIELAGQSVGEDVENALNRGARTFSDLVTQAAQNINININTQNPPVSQNPGFQFGGVNINPRFLQDGGLGLRRGVDTIPVLASAGESIINSRSTAKFFSQIQAINAGQRPVASAASGNSTSIGDINVTIEGGGRNINGREIAQAIQRELRRRTI